MADYILGMNAKLYVGAADTPLASLTEMGNVKDVTLTLESGEADVTTRSNSGWRATAATLRECTLEFETVWKNDDTNFELLRDAFLNATEIAAAALTGDRNDSGSEGPRGNWTVTSFTRNEALEEAITASVTLKLARFDEWVTV